MNILTLNTGSSSIKFSLFAMEGLREIARGQLSGIGRAGRLEFERDGATLKRDAPAATREEALHSALSAIADAGLASDVGAIGHRIVHGGMRFSAPAVLTPDVMVALEALCPLAPLHQPFNLEGVRAAMALAPGAKQIGCFDTAFHWGKPTSEDLFALPRRFHDLGVRRYGFHGLSYEHATQILKQRFPTLAAGRVVIAHLGSGASMCGVMAGKPVGSTMGFSALDGLPMGTRCGQLDPGVLLWMLRSQNMSAEDIERVLYHESGLKGLSGLSGDMRELKAAGTAHAQEAIAYFIARCRREVGALAAVMGGLDGLVFTGGIGENDADVRAGIVEGLGFMGLRLDPAANVAAAEQIGAEGQVLIIPADEERMIATHAAALAA
jgi:acetate kinase